MVRSTELKLVSILTSLLVLQWEDEMVFKAQVVACPTSLSGRINGYFYVFHFLLFSQCSDRQSLKNNHRNSWITSDKERHQEHLEVVKDANFLLQDGLVILAWIISCLCIGFDDSYSPWFASRPRWAAKFSYNKDFKHLTKRNIQNSLPQHFKDLLHFATCNFLNGNLLGVYFVGINLLLDLISAPFSFELNLWCLFFPLTKFSIGQVCELEGPIQW